MILAFSVICFTLFALFEHLVFVTSGLRVSKNVPVRILHHRKHPQRWPDQRNVGHHRRAATAYTPLTDTAAVSSDVAANTTDIGVNAAAVAASPSRSYPSAARLDSLCSGHGPGSRRGPHRLEHLEPHSRERGDLRAQVGRGPTGAGRGGPADGRGRRAGRPLLEQIAVGPPGGTVWGRSSATGEATVLLDANNQAGLAELKVLSIGGCQLNALDQTISLNTSSGPANLLMEANTGGGSDGEVICFYGFQNLSDESLKTNLRAVPAEEAQEAFDGVEATYYDPVDGPSNQVGFVAQQVEASGALGKRLCKLKRFDDRELMTLDYQRMTAVLWQVCKGLQKRIEKLEKKKRRGDESD